MSLLDFHNVMLFGCYHHSHFSQDAAVSAFLAIWRRTFGEYAGIACRLCGAAQSDEESGGSTSCGLDALGGMVVNLLNDVPKRQKVNAY